MVGDEKKVPARPRLRLVRPWRWVFLMGFGTFTAATTGVAVSRGQFDGVTVLAMLSVGTLLLGILILLEARNPQSEVVRKNVIPPRVLHRTVSGEAGSLHLVPEEPKRSPRG